MKHNHKLRLLPSVIFPIDQQFRQASMHSKTRGTSAREFLQSLYKWFSKIFHVTYIVNKRKDA